VAGGIVGVTWHYLKTFLWLRWRLRANRRRKAGPFSAALQTFVTILAIAAAALGLSIGFFVGLLALRQAPTSVLMMAWDGAVAAFLFFWLVELLAELQRSELLSFEKLLHLPVSLSGVFLINYVGSLFSISAIFWIPAMIGLAIGLVISRGPIMLLLFPLIAMFVLALTAITFQFRGWLASMMVNQRKRRTIVAFASLAFILLFQIPNILNLTRFSGRPTGRAEQQMRSQRQELERALAAGEINKDEYDRRVQPLTPQRRSWEETVSTATVVNQIVPFGWLPYGAMALAEKNAVPALMGTLGLGLIGLLSLRRSYGTTLRLYTGDFGDRKKRPEVVVNAAPTLKPTATFFEKRLPGLSEHASAVALAGFRSLTRAPEAKMMLLSPVIMVVVFGGMFSRMASNPSPFLRPLIASGSVAMLLLTMTSLAGNQFGFDRGGFRVFVLTPARRRDILLGKNMSMVPFIVTLALLVTVLIEILYPMRLDHFVATLLQLIPMYLVFSLVANLLSILAPMPIKAGSLKPASPKGMAILIHVGFVFLFPLALAPTMIPLGIEFLLSWAGRYTWFPAYLILTGVEFALVAYLYPLLLDLEGSLLQQRELRILEVVTSKIE
jgi:hypothetical protein